MKTQCDLLPKKNPAKVQVEIRSLNYGPMTLKDGRTKLKMLFKKKGKESYYFPIIFDECNLQGIGGTSASAQTERLEKGRKFTFLRSIVRSLLCIPIFMGTNAQAANFLGLPKDTDAASGAKNRSCWCLVWHRPPNVAKTFFKDKFASIRDAVREFKKDTKSKYPSGKLLKFLEKYFAFERPLFLVDAEIFVLYYCQTMSSPCPSDEEFLALLLEGIMEKYIERKELPLMVNCGQIAYMSAFTWDRGLLAEGGKLTKTAFKTDLYIHGHFGFLHAKADDIRFPKYTSITTTDKGKGYKRIYLLSGNKFFISTRFQEFRDAPLTGLIVTGITADNQRVLTVKDDENLDPHNLIVGKQKGLGNKRISLVAAIEKSIDAIKMSAVNHAPKNSGFRLELALFAASILASRAGGFKGCAFSDFLEHLAREFDFEGEYGDGIGPLAIIFPDEFPQPLRERQIPFLASMAISDWEPKFAKQLMNIFDAYLGVATPSIKQEVADLLITDYP